MLRVLQNGEVEPVGMQTTVRVDVRVIAATNRDLEREIADGRFREDLYYRLNVIPIVTPPLRERLDDIPQLVEHFVERFAAEANYRRKRFSAEAIDHLRHLPWQGNVRELRNVVERLLILAEGDTVGRDQVVHLAPGRSGEGSEALFTLPTLREFREASERMFLLRKLEESGWNVTQTAQAIDTPRSNLYKKLESYGIRRDGAAS